MQKKRWEVPQTAVSDDLIASLFKRTQFLLFLGSLLLYLFIYFLFYFFHSRSDLSFHCLDEWFVDGALQYA